MYEYNRYFSWNSAKEVEYLSLKKNTPLLSKPWLDKGKFSRDAGKSFKYEENLVLFGNYYFLGGDMDEYSYEAFDIVSLASNFGGLIEFVYIFLSLYPFWFYNPKVT